MAFEGAAKGKDRPEAAQVSDLSDVGLGTTQKGGGGTPVEDRSDRHSSREYQRQGRRGIHQRGAQDFGVTLVAEDRTNAALIVEADSPKSLRAAEAIRIYVKKMSGAKLRLVFAGRVGNQNTF